MTKFRFNGANGTHLGRHGILQSGDCIYLSDAELASVANLSTFTQIDATASDQRLVEIVFGSIGFAVPGTNKKSIVLPYDLYLTSVQAFVDYPQAAGAVTVDINKNGASVLSTKLTVDASESSSATAAVPAVISDPVLPSGSTISIDVDSAPAITDPAVAGGLRVVLVGTSPNARIRVTEATASP